MARKSTHSHSFQSVATLILLALALSILFLLLNRVALQSPDVIGQAIWIAVEIVRPMALDHLHTAVAYFFPGSCVLQHLPDLGTSIVSLLCLIVG
jgi:cellulose synthase/poly-beta-1,6-N-acetylglucosamine synthase-like glycosyltransferase